MSLLPVTVATTKMTAHRYAKHKDKSYPRCSTAVSLPEAEMRKKSFTAPYLLNAGLLSVPSVVVSRSMLTPSPTPSPNNLRPPSPGVNHLHNMKIKHRGALSMSEQYDYDISRAQLKASSRISALLSGFAMVALVELQYDPQTPHYLLIILGVVTTLLVTVHMLALMMSTCILPYMEANGPTQDSPHLRLRVYIDLSWIFSTCIGLILFLVELGVIFWVKFQNVGYEVVAYITTAMLVPAIFVFIIFSYLIHKNRITHSIDRIRDKVARINELFDFDHKRHAVVPHDVKHV